SQCVSSQWGKLRAISRSRVIAMRALLLWVPGLWDPSAIDSEAPATARLPANEEATRNWRRESFTIWDADRIKGTRLSKGQSPSNGIFDVPNHGRLEPPSAIGQLMISHRADRLNIGVRLEFHHRVPSVSDFGVSHPV